MNNRRKQRTMALIIALLIVVSSFNIGYDGVGIVKAEESIEITETVEGDGIEPSTEALVDESKKVTEEEIDDAISEYELEETDDEDNLDSELDIISETNAKYNGDGYTVDFILDSQWDSGYNATVTITNTSDTKIENWSIIMPLNNRFSNIWNAVVTDEYEDYYVIKNAGWNQDIPVNASVSFGISSNEKFAGYPKYYSIVGKKTETKTSDYKIEYKVIDAWEDGLIGQIKITNIRDKSIEDWRLHFNYSGEIVEIWDAVIVSHENDVYGISCENYNQNIEAGKSVTFGFKVSSGNESEPEGLKLEEYSDEKNRYIAIMGEQVEEGILLSTFCSSKCGEYVYYISKDGKNYYELDKSQECEFLYKDTKIKNGKLYFYVIGNTKNENFKSECVVVEYSNSECTIINYDTDSDLLCDYLEYCYGTDVENIDTDGDGLSDYYETEYTLTDPLIEDTDDNDIKDADEDFDDDKLSNIIEFQYMTNPCSYDTDEDGFSDYYEINHNMNPLVYDAINIDSKIVSTLNDYTEVDLQVMNVDEYYPLEIEYNDELVMSISGKYSDIRVESPIEALYAIYNVKTLLGLDDPKEQLRFDKVVHHNSGDSYTFLQYHKGIKILDNMITISVDNEYTVTSLYADIVLDSEMNDYDYQTILQKNEVERIIYNSYNDCKIINSEVALYFHDIEKTISPIYIFKIIKDDDLYNIILDAISGKIIEEYTDSMYETVDGFGYMEDGKTKTKIKFPLNKVTNKEYKYIMEDTYRKIHVFNDKDKKYYYLDTKYTSLKNDDWPDKTANSAYYNVIKVYDWWKKTCNYIGIDGKGGIVRVFLHNPDDKNNARYVNSNGKEKIYFYDNSPKTKISKASDLSCVGHEFTHAIVFHNTKLRNSNKVTATINEAYADIFGSLISEGWRKQPRNIKAPNLTANPQKVDGTYYDKDFKEEHKNSTIISHVAYLLTQKEDGYTTIDMNRQAVLWYDSLSEGFNNKSNFNTVRTNIIKAARKNNFSNEEIRTIKRAFDKVGVLGEKGKIKIRVYLGNESIKDAKVTFINYGSKLSKKTNKNGEVLFNSAEVGMSTIKVEYKEFEPIYTQIMVKKNKTVTKNIYLLSASSNFDWIKYDHYNYKQPYVNSLPKHILFEKDSIKMMGYTQDAIKDFLITNDINNGDSYALTQKYLSFKIERDKNDWHTMEGGGFLFNILYKNKKISGYCILVTQGGLRLYELKNIDAQSFSDGKNGNISKIGKLLGQYNIGDVLSQHKISLRVTNNNVSLWSDDKIIMDNYKLPREYGYDFGPITSHSKHDCRQQSFFTFSDIQMSSSCEK